MSALTPSAEDSFRPAQYASPMTSFTMGWRELPDDMNALVVGGAYSLSLHHALTHVRTISSILSANLQQQRPCALLTPMAPETFLKRCPAAQQKMMRAAVEQKSLLIFTVLGDAQKNIVRFGPQRLLAELAAAGIDDSRLIIVDQAETLFSLHHQENAKTQLSSFLQWLQQHDCTGIFLFSKVSEDSALSWTHYLLTEGMNGSAHLDHDRGETELWIDFWQTPQTTLGEHHIRLPNGLLSGQPRKPEVTPSIPLLRLTPRTRAESAPSDQADDASDLYYLETLHLPAGMLKSWRTKPVSSLLELVQATRHARHAAVLIAVDRNSDWLQLAQAVHAIRSQAGATVRIVILDQARCIRYQHEALMLRVGANLVLRAADALTRLPLMLDSLQSQYFRLSETVSLEDAVAGATPPPLKGYVPPLVFCKMAQESLVRARALALPCILIALPYPLPQEFFSSLEDSHFSREGDLLTIVSRHCYLFLYGCVTQDYQALLQRLIGNGATISLDALTILNEETAILDLLKLVAERCVSGAADLAQTLSAHSSSDQQQVA